MTTLDSKASASRTQIAPTPPIPDQRTPGDWTFGIRHDMRGYWVGPSELEAVAKTYQRSERGRRGETRANARMLAAGPELIRHIRNIARLHDLASEDSGHPDFIDAIDAAVEAANRIEKP